MGKPRGVENMIIPLALIDPHPRNYNKHSDAQLADLEKSLDRFGQVRSIVVQRNGKRFTGVAGHGITEAAKRKGYTELRADVIPAAWSPSRVLAYLAADNELARQGDPDQAQLAAIVQGLKAEGEDALAELAAGGQAALDALLAANNKVEETADVGALVDRAADLQKKWNVARGDVWEVGKHKLMCGDSTSAEDVGRLMGGERAQAVVSDVPYGMDLDTDWSGIEGSLRSIGAKNHTRGNRYEQVIGDDKPFDPTPIFDLFGYCKEMFLFGADYYAEKIPNRAAGSWIVWDKRKDSQADAIGAEFELIWSKAKHKRRMLRHDWFGFLSSENGKDARDRKHPTQKPITLIADILNQWIDEEAIVFDGYCGSGTTLVACEQTGRVGRGMELEPKYCAVTLERLALLGLTPKRIENVGNGKQNPIGGYTDQAQAKRTPANQPQLARQSKRAVESGRPVA